MVVKKSFYCVQEKKTYKTGENYTGSRKEIEYLLETSEKKKKVLKPKLNIK